MDQKMFYTPEELRTLSDLTLIEARIRFQQLYSLLKEDAPEGTAYRDQVGKALREIQAEMHARGFSGADPNRS